MHAMRMLLALAAACTLGSQAVRPQHPVSEAVKYERGDCLYETVACMRDDSCGPLLRLVYAYCYETPDYLQQRPDGSRLACDSSCAALLSVFFNTSAGLRLRECNHSSYPFWADLVVHKQAVCAPLLSRTDRLLQRALSGTVRAECWLAGLLCARDFSCRATLMGVLDLPCYDGPCSRECANRMTNFGKMFNDVFHTFISCLCGQDLAAACPTLASGYLSNRSAALDHMPFMAPLDRLIDQLGRGAIMEQVRDSIWLLRVFEHRFYCLSLKTIISEPNCVPPVQPQPVDSEPLCSLESVYQWPSTTASATTASSRESSTSPDSLSAEPDSLSPQQPRQLETQWQQPTKAYPRGAAAADATVTGAQQLTCTAVTSLLLACSSLAPLATRLTLY